mmetsp:Transcript_114765/g.161164  ORF Transcript_114765/g.161164 Transcript_114765/m.161164 type:complete len:262 (+) Transcript_114765:439-1224(+)
MVPCLPKKALRVSSSTRSSRFLTYRLRPSTERWNSRRFSCADLATWRLRSALAMARLTERVRRAGPPEAGASPEAGTWSGLASSMPLSSRTARLAASDSAKLAKQKPRGLPSSSVGTKRDVISPMGVRRPRMSSSVKERGYCFTYTLVHLASSMRRSRLRNISALMTAPSNSELLYSRTASAASSSFSYCTKPWPRNCLVSREKGTLQLITVPNMEAESCTTLGPTVGGRFLSTMLHFSLARLSLSRLAHMMRHGAPSKGV